MPSRRYQKNRRQKKTRKIFRKWKLSISNFQSRIQKLGKNLEYAMPNLNRSSLKDLGKAWLRALKEGSECMSCGENHSACLEFHHLDPREKTGTLSQLVKASAPLEVLQAELDKCVCLCSNCHRKVHAGDLELAGKPQLPNYVIHRTWNP